MSSLPCHCGAVTHTQQDGLMLSPYLEEHHLQMSRKSDLEWLDRQAFVERDSDTTKVPRVLSRRCHLEYPLRCPKLSGTDSFINVFYRCNNVRGMRYHVAVDEVLDVRLQVP
ncbi:hypothetical protein Pcinc_019793 [Petrolisthes cinctipes]|uniref:Uncharacterized protein n=1 Tax=Petrolisthes cinctipes TaxID=88211 RepID=A0AAE1KL33_PETCI|nr:hypothetical protein Pcinc_019793 [Petrolisthes cinctipes]